MLLCSPLYVLTSIDIFFLFFSCPQYGSTPGDAATDLRLAKTLEASGGILMFSFLSPYSSDSSAFRIVRHVVSNVFSTIVGISYAYRFSSLCVDIPCLHRCLVVFLLIFRACL